MKNSASLGIRQKIFKVRGCQVILDRDVAQLYHVSTKVLNQAVKRNSNRFPDGFMFRLTETEIQFSRSQFVTLNDGSKGRGHNLKYAPFAFTELGVAMLSTILKSDLAVSISIEIIQVFIQLKSNMGNQYLILNRLDCLESKVVEHDLKFNQMMENQCKDEDRRSEVFFENQIFDAYVFSSELIASAEKSIVLLDNYIDETTLLQLSKRNPKVSCVVYTEKVTDQLRLDLEKHNAQYSAIEIRVKKHFHDRFLIIDEKELYHLGASLKDLGKRWFAFSKMDELLGDVMKRFK